jgi:hypothetical protein
LGQFPGIVMRRFGQLFPPLPEYPCLRHTCPLNANAILSVRHGSPGTG